MATKLPSPVQVGGKVYHFRWDGELRDRQRWGETDCDAGIITLNTMLRTAPRQLLDEVVTHELLHAIAHEWQIRFLNDNSEESERCVRSLATGLRQVGPQTGGLLA